MSNYRLEQIIAPRSVALVGASPRPRSLGNSILDNLRRANPNVAPILVNPAHESIDGLPCHKNLLELSEPPDLVVIAVPPESVNDIVAQACAIGAAGAVIITAGLGHGDGSISDLVRKTARKGGLRIIGPNCVGLLSPFAGLDASFLSRTVRAGNLALISQSGAIIATLAEWAHNHNVGFSGIVSLGDQIDVDFADCLDHFAVDRQTEAILLYIESIGDARKFLAAARAASQIKPVIVVKAGRHAAGAKAALSHTGAMTGSDAVYDAAFRRVGMLRVIDLEELFAAAETLARSVRIRGERIGVLTNGGGIGVLAVDRLIDLSGQLGTLAPETLAALDERLPATWSRSNPIDIIGDADAARYEMALTCLLESKDVDAVLAINCPTALVSSAEAARAVARAVTGVSRQHPLANKKPVFAVWFGEEDASAQEFDAANIPHFNTEIDAVRGLMYLVDYNRVQASLLTPPPGRPEETKPDVIAARRIIDAALEAGRAWLDPVEVTQVLEAYAIPNAPCRRARDRAEVERLAMALLGNSAALAMKILSPDLTHKSDAGGVRLGLRTPEEAGRVFDEMIGSVKARRPDVRIEGVILQPMIEQSKAIELIVGLTDDPTFGPVILFGQGGVAVEAIDDHVLALPPLDLKLARDMIARSRVSRLLAGYRDVPRADIDAIALVLVKVALMSADLPEILELDLNPLVASAESVVTVDARIRVAKCPVPDRGVPNPRFAIRPYPGEWECSVALADGRKCNIRPLRPEDAKLYEDFFGRLSPDDLRRRFFASMDHVSAELIARLTQIDYARTMVLIALDPADGAMLGGVRLHTDRDRERGEFAIITRSDIHGEGLGWALMEKCIAFARAEGVNWIGGQVLADNWEMLKMCRELGFEIQTEPAAPEIKNVHLRIGASAGASQTI